MDDERIIDKQKYNIVGETINLEQQSFSPEELELLQEEFAGHSGLEYSNDAYIFLNAGLTPIIVRINGEFKMTSLEFIEGDMN